MKHLLRVLCLASLVLATSAWAAVPQLINFQGVLNTPGGTPVANGNYALTFRIYDAATGGVMLWQEGQAVNTSGGVFSVLLGSINPIPDSAFGDTVRYLGITVSPDAEMAPRQRISSVAYAQRVGSLMGASGGISVEPGDPDDTAFVSLLEDGVPGTDMACPVPPPVAGPCIGLVTTTFGTPTNPIGQRAGRIRVIDCNGVQNFVVNGWNGDVQARGKATIGWGQINGGFYGFVAGAYNTTTFNTKMPTIPGGYCNIASADYTSVGGGNGNTASGIYGHVGGGLSNLASGPASTVGGGNSNQATIQGATVAGGDINTAMGNFSTVGGGHQNVAVLDFGTVAGGEANTANNMWASIGGGQQNDAKGLLSTIAGGRNNRAADTGSTVGGGAGHQSTGYFSTIAGGQGDSASGGYSAIGGGQRNIASGTWSTVPGGLGNIASGSGTLAAGTGAQAIHDCSFVWADCCVDALGVNQPFFSQTFNSFNARATGGFYLATSCDPPGLISSGVSVPPGGAAWVSLSDSTAKHSIRPVDGMEVLQKLEQLNIHRWKYKSQGDGADHIGPMAQDFYRLFQVGEDDRHISTLDPDGIALAAAKELFALSQTQKAELETLRSQLAQQSDEVGALKAQLAGLEAAVQAVLAGAATRGDLKLSAVTDAAQTGR